MVVEVSVLKRKPTFRRLIHRLISSLKDCRHRKSCWSWILVSWFSLILLVILLKLLNVIFPPESPSTSSDRHYKNYVVKTDGCRIPDLDPFDAAIQKYPFDRQKVRCLSGTPPLVGSNGTSIFLIHDSVVLYDVNEVKGLQCCFVPFWTNISDNRYVVRFGNSCITFEGSVRIQHEFIMVKCFYLNTIIYKDFFIFVPEKPPNKRFSRELLNVLILGIDEVSRLNFHRQLPQTVDVLTKLKATEFFGYNKISNDIFANIVAMLIGVNIDDLRNICWPNANGYFDNCPFVWKLFEDRGYLTAFAEDATWNGIFQYGKRGFYKKPTHYFWDPFNRIAQLKIGNQNKSNVSQCIGNRELYEVLLEYLEKFTTKMLETNNNFFGFFWTTSLSHQSLNKPKTGDNQLSGLISRLNSTGILNNTLLVLTSDGGATSNAIRLTLQGNLESRLPFLYVLLPEWYKIQHPLAYSNLKENSHKLITPYDIHETIMDLLDGNKSQRGQSLFTPIPSTRKCVDVNIDNDICACAEESEVPTENNTVRKIAEFIIEYISLLLNKTQCVPLKLDSVLYAKRYSLQNASDVDVIEDYSIGIKTKPKGIEVEATVRKTRLNEGYNLKMIENLVVKSDGSIRHNSCTTDYFLKTLCFCN